MKLPLSCGAFVYLHVYRGMLAQGVLSHSVELSTCEGRKKKKRKNTGATTPRERREAMGRHERNRGCGNRTRAQMVL